MYYFYARCSTQQQHEDRQIIAFNEFIKKECQGEETKIIVEKQSGKDFNREKYRWMIRKMKEDDTLVVLSIDRLGRNYTEILDEWRRITKDKKCHVVVMDMPLLDTRNERDLTGVLIADIVLQLLSYCAETERRNISIRTAAGMAAAKERGVKLGRPRMKKPEKFDEVLDRYLSGELTSRMAAAEIGIAQSTFVTWIKECRIWPEEEADAQAEGTQQTKGAEDIDQPKVAAQAEAVEA